MPCLIKQLLVCERFPENKCTCHRGQITPKIYCVLVDQLCERHLQVIVVWGRRQKRITCSFGTSKSYRANVHVGEYGLVLEEIVEWLVPFEFEVDVNSTKFQQYFVSQDVGRHRVNRLCRGFVFLAYRLQQIEADREVRDGYVLVPPKRHFEVLVRVDESAMEFHPQLVDFAFAEPNLMDFGWDLVGRVSLEGGVFQGVVLVGKQVVQRQRMEGSVEFEVGYFDLFSFGNAVDADCGQCLGDSADLEVVDDLEHVEHEGDLGLEELNLDFFEDPKRHHLHQVRFEHLDVPQFLFKYPTIFTERFQSELILLTQSNFLSVLIRDFEEIIVESHRQGGQHLLHHISVEFDVVARRNGQCPVGTVRVHTLVHGMTRGHLVGQNPQFGPDYSPIRHHLLQMRRDLENATLLPISIGDIQNDSRLRILRCQVLLSD